MKDKLAYYGVDKYEDLTLVEDTKNEGMNRGFAFLDFSSRADAWKLANACKRGMLCSVQIEQQELHLQTLS